MPKIIIPILIALLNSIGCLANNAEFNIATYNLRQQNANDDNNGNGWNIRCPIIAQLIRFHEFDIFGTQEGFKNQLEDLKALLPGYDYIGVARDDGKNEGEHSAIFYNVEEFELLDHGDFWLSETPDRPSIGWDAACIRICTWGKFLHKPSKKVFQFLNLHLDHVGTTARKESCRLLLKKIKDFNLDLPTFVSGDFNVDQHNEIYGILSDSDFLSDSFDSAQFKYSLNGTYNAYQTQGFTDSRIDHIFISDNINVKKYGVLTDTYRSLLNSRETLPPGDAPAEIEIRDYIARTPSDHFPVMIKVEF
ncbi:MAG: endonuclease/exonuclease/phosphatase family protein [Muribaculaceae bacterium]|nr:endonuclease/exonuclease/phosphatase family protein [Muribaculaceae bacterium]